MLTPEKLGIVSIFYIHPIRLAARPTEHLTPPWHLHQLPDRRPSYETRPRPP